MKYLASDPKILNGKLVIKGTRVPVSLIIYLLKDGFTTENIQEQYPHISVNKIEGAINEASEILENPQAVL